MKVNFILKAPPFSINNYLYSRTMTRTKEARAWGEDIHKQIMFNKPLCEQFTKMYNKFNPVENTFNIELVHSIPHNKYYTKAGNISKASMDLSNIEKPLIDLIFSEKYRERDHVPVLGVDDCFISSMISKKIPGNADENRIYVSIKMVSLDKLDKWRNGFLIPKWARPSE